MFKVKVKWGKETFSDVEVDTLEEPMVFKAQLFALTGVQPDRQKVMVKGAVLKDNDWGNIKLKDGAVVLLMGSKEALPSEPAEKPVFMEDMSESELATALDLPSGLTNLGNTCYMNATVQCLRTVPELKEALAKFQGELYLSRTSGVGAQSVTAALRDLYGVMDRSAVVPPIVMLQVLHMAFPRFSEKSEHGGFTQQDANECWTEMVRMLQQKLPAGDQAATETTAAQPTKYSNFVDQYFGGIFDVTLKCIESEDEPETKTTEHFLQLSCFISQDVKYMYAGLKSRLLETIRKMSPTLGRDAEYKKMVSLSERVNVYLYLIDAFTTYKDMYIMRVSKDIKFTMQLDMFELCSEALQQKLIPMRTKFKEEEDRKLDVAQKASPAKSCSSGTCNFSGRDEMLHPGSNNSGYYELQAVLTHKGRSTSTGHYVAWIRRKEDEWFKCDDDKVSLVSADEILKLSGGGDWHTAYVLLYGPRLLEVEEDLPCP
ncbi:Queuine tRNA-ribosyltransferase, putative [Ixodes scapularis]|uniref:Ubiquitin carboxyl-terminal hydrolase n=1 Tax=Ixodes scapularis TaxID=6945 RepID=B7PWY6_IXOSC|nr:Queuine tRNA-ribosyltransferase, putative [Ixodes scapularis]|eukprot:XP_002410386.1 Queuine tRNA-ribosyltransferase, putative [Ixodes scapularis]